MKLKILLLLLLSVFLWAGSSLAIPIQTSTSQAGVGLEWQDFGNDGTPSTLLSNPFSEGRRYRFLWNRVWNSGFFHCFFIRWCPSVKPPDPPVSVPEPSTMLLFGSGLIGLAVLGRKKFFKKS